MAHQCFEKRKTSELTMAHEDSARHIGGLLRLMAARGLTPAEIIEASWSESHGRISHLTVQLHADRTLSCGGQRYHAIARRL